MNKKDQLSKKKYVIGTRGSLLAITQCNQIKSSLEDKTGDEYELKIIKTEGDIKTDKPLWQMEGKDFFTKELDQALLKNEIDLVVHSYKDLGSERPEGIGLGAITQRFYPHDILLINESVVNSMIGGTFNQTLEVGTSSPRRIHNIEKYLADYLPGNVQKIETKQLRGNVNTRIRKLVNGEYHAIVLALPGLERLAQSKESANEISPLLKRLNFSILPTSQFPAAASQGALGIEYNKNRFDKGELAKKLDQVNHSETARAVKVERDHFQKFGGGCHLAVGITTRLTNGHLVTSMRGESNSKMISENFIEGINRERIPSCHVFIGVNTETKDFISDKLFKRSPLNWKDIEGACKFVTTKHAISDGESVKALQKNLVFSAGTKTWKELCNRSIWVNGSADSLGENELLSLKGSSFLKLITDSKISKDWQVLTHKDGDSNLGEATEAYTSSEKEISDQFYNDIKKCEVFFWSSFRQYQGYVAKFPFIKNRTHCTGIGKTYQQFRISGIKAVPFSGMKEFKSWVNIIERIS